MNRQARVLFLGCNGNQVPYLLAARALGFAVVGCDRNPQAPGATLCDRFHPVGYHDLAGLAAVARAEGLGSEDRVFTASAHLAYEGAEAVARVAGIPFPSRAAIATALDKCRFYAALARAGLPVPPTRVVEADETPEPDPDRAYWLKSDYGKSPRYCWRVVDGRLPERPEAFDAFYRGRFLLQDEVAGRHWRVNLWGDQAAVFVCEPGGGWHPQRDLGACHGTVVSALRSFVAGLGMAGWLTKFDLIERDGTHWVLDLGLDPPMRLRRLCEGRGVDFAAAYARLYLRGDETALPPWSALAPDAPRAGRGRRAPEGRPCA